MSENNNEPMTAEQRLRELFGYADGAELEDRDKPLVVLIEEHTKVAVEAAEGRWMLDRVRCACSAADACRFARERDEARNMIATIVYEWDQHGDTDALHDLCRMKPEWIRSI